MINYFLGLALVACTFFLKLYFPVDIRTGHQMWFVFFGFLSLMIFPKPQTSLRNLFVGAYFLASAFLLPDLFYKQWTFFQWLICSVAVLWFSQIASSKLDKKILYPVFAILCIAQSAWVVLNWLGYDPYAIVMGLQKITKSEKGWIDAPKLITGSLGHSTLAGAFITFTMPFVIKRNKWAALLPLIAIYLTNSSMAFVGALLVKVYLDFYDSKYKKTAYAAGFIAIVGAFSYGALKDGFFSHSSRLQHWWNLLKNHGLNSPIFGNGPGFTEGLDLQLMGGSEILRPEHNEILTLYIQYGIFGLIAIGLLIPKFLRAFNGSSDKYLKAGIVAIGFNCLGSFPLHIASMTLLSMVYLSLLKED